MNSGQAVLAAIGREVRGLQRAGAEGTITAVIPCTEYRRLREKYPDWERDGSWFAIQFPTRKREYVVALIHPVGPL